MNLGRPISLLIIILIAFGYVVSDDLHTHKDLKGTLTRMESLNTQMAGMTEELASCQKTVENDQQVISQQGTEIARLNSVISAKDNEIRSLKTENSRQTNRINELEGSLLKLTEDKNKVQTAEPDRAWLQLDPKMLSVILALQLILLVIQRRQKNGYVRLSARERAEIIKMRRLKKM